MHRPHLAERNDYIVDISQRKIVAESRVHVWRVHHDSVYFGAAASVCNRPGTRRLVPRGVSTSWQRTAVLPTKYVWRSATTRLYVLAVSPVFFSRTGVLPVAVCSRFCDSRSRALIQPLPEFQKR